MLNNQCQTCQTTQQPLMLDSQTEEIEQRLGTNRINKWGSEMSFLEFYNCKPCWIKGVDQAEKIAFENYNDKDISQLPYETRYRYLKQGLGRVKELLGK